MIPLHPISQYGHPHCVKTLRASGACKRPPCLCSSALAFSFKTEIEVERCFLKYLGSPLRNCLRAQCLWCRALFGAVDETASSLQYHQHPSGDCFRIVPIYLFWPINALPERGTCTVLHLGEGVLVQAVSHSTRAFRRRQKATEGGFFPIEEAEAGRILCGDIGLADG